MCNNHPAHTSPWLILAHQCTYCNIACSPAICTEDHTAVSGFSGNTNRATHRGDFNCVVRSQRGRLIHLVDPSSPLVIPDTTEIFIPCDTLKTLASPRNTVICQVGLSPYGDPDLFNYFALNTEIQQPPVKPIFSHNGRFNAHSDLVNENGCFAKFSETETLSTACAFTP